MFHNFFVKHVQIFLCKKFSPPFKHDSFSLVVNQYGPSTTTIVLALRQRMKVEIGNALRLCVHRCIPFQGVQLQKVGCDTEFGYAQAQPDVRELQTGFIFYRPLGETAGLR
jgi:hypothetical protein